MSNGISPRSRRFSSGLAAVATTVLLMSTLVGAFDTRLLTEQDVSAPASAVTAELRRDALVVRRA